jgi:hypothetical protein
VKVTSNPARYRKLSEPKADAAAAEAAVEAFFEGVSKLREEHGIPQCLVTAAGSYLDPEAPEGEGEYFMSLTLGDALKGVYHAARLAGVMQADLAANLETIAAGPRRRRKAD